MSYIIAITGKGGVGKTTLAGMLVNRLIKRDRKPVLAIDADPNTCLDAILGVKAENSIGKVREEAREIAGKGMSAGISKQELLEMKISESLVEAKDFDLIAMGRPEGPGCYCYANNVLKSVINQISEHYPYIVLDNEAGLENLSRRIVQEVDVLTIVSNPSNSGLETVKRLHGLAQEMGIKYKKLAIIVNRTRKGLVPELAAKIKKETNADFLVNLPDNAEVADISESTQKIGDISDNNPIIEKIDQLLESIGL